METAQQAEVLFRVGCEQGAELGRQARSGTGLEDGRLWA